MNDQAIMADCYRRQFIRAAGAGALGGLAGATRLPAASAPAPAQAALPLSDFEPRSMLQVPESHVPTPKFPAIDVHSHLTFTALSRRGVRVGEKVAFGTTTSDALALMDRKGLRAMVNLTGGTGAGLEQTLDEFDRKAPGRFFTCTEPSYAHFLEPRYPQMQAEAIAAAHRAGAKGLKILKTLGLYLRERIDEGPLVRVDDRRFDPMWEACAAARLPVFIHTGDPEAFFLPIDRFNERWDELGNHPDWSFHGRDFPSFQELMAARERLFARHPKTTFVALHVGHNAENLASVAQMLERFPNVSVEIGARIGELGRQPRAARQFFDRFQDRILFGTDAVPPPGGLRTPQQVFTNELYEIYYRFLETEDEYFDYAPAPVPPQGRWRIYGLGLPDSILRKVYQDNAVRVLGLPA